VTFFAEQKSGGLLLFCIIAAGAVLEAIKVGCQLLPRNSLKSSIFCKAKIVAQGIFLRLKLKISGFSYTQL